MPIKCAGAPQKALYLSADYWQRHGCLRDIDLSFYNAGGVLFGVKDYVPALAANIVEDIRNRPDNYIYDGYGSCPLTVENGKIILAEFVYGGKLKPTFPNWLLDGKKATRLAWILKKDMLPAIYWHGMLKGREWLAAPKAPR